MKRIRSTLSLFLPVIFTLSATANSAIDPYGGDDRLTGGNTSGYFRIEKINGRYWLLTPDNHGFFSLAHTTTLYNDTWGGYCPALHSYPTPYGNKAKYNNNYNAWVSSLLARMNYYGFNSLGAWGQSGIPNLTENVNVLFISDRARSLGCRQVAGTNFLDVWDPLFHQACVNASAGMASKATNPFVIGSFPDNELHWQGLASWTASGKSLAECFIDFPSAASGKQYFVNTFLPGRHADIAALNTAWGTSYADWNAVLNMTSSDIPDNASYPARFDDKLAFTEAIADKYYNETTTAMRAADPNHLVFSARWALWTSAYRNDAEWSRHAQYAARIWKKAGQYSDIFSVNSYMDFASLETSYTFFTRLFQNAKKPVMITEWASFADDTAYAYNPGWGRYQKNRGQWYETQVKYLVDLNLPNDPNDGQPAKIVLGTQWFQFYDEPSLGRTDYEKVNFGLYNVKDEAYYTCLEPMRTVNRQVYDRMIAGQAITTLAAPSLNYPSQLQITAAVCSTSISGWPKEHAIDGSTNSCWSSQSMPGATGTTQYIGVDFGRVYDNITTLIAHPRPHPTPSINCFPVDFALQTSSNGSSWTTLSGQDYTNYPNPNGAVQTFTFAPQSARFIRILGTKFRQDDFNNYFMQMAELQVSQTPQTPQVAVSKPVFQWSAVAGAQTYCLLYSPEKCFPENQTVRVDGLTGLSHTAAQPLTAGRWYWTVAGVTSAGNIGTFADPVTFEVAGLDYSLHTPRFLKMEDISAWGHKALEDGGWDATVYAFPDSASKTEGGSSARMVFTVNSLNKQTGIKNAQTSETALSYKGPELNFERESKFRFDILPARVMDASGVMTVASKYLRFRMKNAQNATLFDLPVDATGAFTPLQWRTLEYDFPAGVDRTHVTTLEFYVSCAQVAVPWDQRMTLWIDNIGPDPLTAAVRDWRRFQ